MDKYEVVFLNGDVMRMDESNYKKTYPSLDYQIVRRIIIRQKDGKTECWKKGEVIPQWVTWPENQGRN